MAIEEGADSGLFLGGGLGLLCEKFEGGHIVGETPGGKRGAGQQAFAFFQRSFLGRDGADDGHGGVVDGRRRLQTVAPGLRVRQFGDD